MSTDTNSRHTDALDELPLSTTELMLGVEITIRPQAMYREMHGLGFSGAQAPTAEIRAVGGGPRSFGLAPGSRSRKYLAAWARRNLFNTSGEKR